MSSAFNTSSSYSASSTVRKSSSKMQDSSNSMDDVTDLGGMHVRHYQVYRGMSPNSSNRLEIRIKDLEESLEVEREARIRAEKECAEIGFQLDGFSERLDEAEGVSSAQCEQGRRKDQELLRLRRDLEVMSQQHESSEATLRKRHQEAINELSEQFEQCKRDKHKSDMARQQLMTELDTCSLTFEAANKAKAAAESRAEGIEDQVRRLQMQYDEVMRQTHDFAGLRARLTQENVDLHRQVQELDANNIMLAKARTALQQKLDEATANQDEELRTRNQLSAQVADLQMEVDNVSASLDEQTDLAAAHRAQLQRSQVEYQQLKTKYDNDISILSEELTESRRKVNNRISELESALEQERNRAAKSEKEKLKLHVELREAVNESEVANANVSDMTQRMKQMDHAAVDLRGRIDELTNELQRLTGDNQRLQTELSRLQPNIDDLQKKLDSFARDNKQLSEVARDAQSQNKDLFRQLHEFQAIRIELESERNILSDQLAETQEALTGVQSRLDAANGLLLQMKTDTERRLKEKDEEIDVIRKSSSRSVEELQRALVDTESKYKSEISRLKRKLETDVEEYEVQLDSLKRANGELAKANRAMATKIKDVEVALDEERRKSEDSKQVALILDRKRIQLQTELDDVRVLLDTAEKARKMATNELSDITVRIHELTTSLTTVSNDKRRIEADMATLLAEAEDSTAGRRAAEERADRAQSELTRISTELHAEQENYRMMDEARRRLEVENRELTVRVEQAESFAQKEGRKLVTKLQARLVELEGELNVEQRRAREFFAENRKLQRVVLDLKNQSEVEIRMTKEHSEQNNALQLRVKTLKRQLEEAEEVVILTMNKYRKAHQLLEECERNCGSNTETSNLSTSSKTYGGSLRNMSVVREVTRVVRI